MSKPVIKIENVGKQYRLGQVGTGTLSQDFNRWWHKVRGKEDPFLKVGEANDRSKKGDSDLVWALQNINFEVNEGEVLGIIGKNGAGKSTLLKILSRVTLPTVGEIKVKGRIASLLEVGTGFHPELSGRENIFLNGAILGMSKQEIKNKFDEIVAFSGVERYIDTPVKRYSSGMYVRLAFAVAAHLEPEILIVDEVLAVGDAEFQKKCLGKMKDVSAEGRTVLFVSHNLQSISTLTTKCIVLGNGQKIYEGEPKDAIDFYFNSGISHNDRYESNKDITKPHIQEVNVITSNPNNIQINGEKLEIEFKIYTPTILEKGAISFQIINNYDIPVVHLWRFSDEKKELFPKGGVHILKCVIPKLHLYMGSYFLRVYFADFNGNTHDYLDSVCHFKVEMFGKHREYEWQANTCIYIEDSQWLIE